MSIVVVLGNSFDIKEDLKSRFKMKFDFQYKVWFRPVLQDKFWYWQQTIEALSPRVSCVWVSDLSKVEEVRSIEKELREEAPTPSHALDNKVFEMSAWYAKAFKENNNTAFAFRNLKILKVSRETQKAYLVDAEFFSGIASSCGVCGRELNNDISRATGIGPICAEKLGLGRPTMDTAKKVVKEMEKLSKDQGVFKGVWVPKSQIKQITEERQNES